MRIIGIDSKFLPAAFAAALLVTACGGGGPSGPTPIGHTLDEAHIARIPLEQRPQVTQAQNDFAIARSEKISAEDALKQAETDVKLAKGEVDQAIIAERQAKVKLDSAKGSADQTRINAAEHESRAALLGRRAADAKYAWAKAKVVYQRKWLRYTEFEVVAKEAKFELEKAKVAKANNINPAGFAYPEFEKQYKNRSEAAQRVKLEADREKGRVAEKEKAWRSAEKEWNQFRGIKESPVAPTTPDGAAIGQPPGGGTP